MSFKVTLEPSKRHYTSQPDATLLGAALEAEISLPSSCRKGACGVCKSKILQGSVDHANSPEFSLSAQDRAEGFTLLCCAKATSDLTIQCLSVPANPQPAKVEHFVKLSEDVALVHLLLSSSRPMSFQAGQYINFVLKDNKRRSFSIANAPRPNLAENTSLELHIRLIEGGEFTHHVFHQMKARDILKIEGPLGSFHLHESDKPIVFLAGGTGFAPIKSMMENIIAKGSARPISLYWGARERTGLYMHDLAKKWAETVPNFHYIPVISNTVPEGWTGKQGLVHEAIMADFPDLSGHEVYACGSPIMIDAARKDFTEQCKLPDDAFFADVFSFEKRS